MRSVAPVLFLGLVVLLFLVAVTAATRLGAFAMAGALVGGIILLAHLAFMWTLVSSTGAGEPLLSRPSGAAVSYGPFVAALGFLLVTGGSAWAARSAEYIFPDVESARPPPSRSVTVARARGRQNTTTVSPTSRCSKVGGRRRLVHADAAVGVDRRVALVEGDPAHEVDGVRHRRCQTGGSPRGEPCG